MEQQKDNEPQLPTTYSLQIPMMSRIRFVPETNPETYYRYGDEKEKEEKEEEEENARGKWEEDNMIDEETHHPFQSELHQTAEILCKLSDSPTIHLPSTPDLLSFLTEANRYTIHPVYSPMHFPNQGIISFPPPNPAFTAHQYPTPISATRTATAVTAIELTPLISEEEWIALTSSEPPRPLDINVCGSPVVEEFLQTYLPLDTPAEDRQGWYEFLCEDGGNEDCWTKFLGSDSGTEFHHEWLEDSGYQEGYQRDL